MCFIEPKLPYFIPLDRILVTQVFRSGWAGRGSRKDLEDRSDCFRIPYKYMKATDKTFNHFNPIFNKVFCR